jgi:hypothetical protein
MAVIVLPFAKNMLRPETLAAVQRTLPHGVRLQSVCVEREPLKDTAGVYRVVGDERVPLNAAGIGYWQLLQHLWTRQETFIVVEQDIVVGARTLARMMQCTNEWCGALYDDTFQTDTVMLGCTKFTASLMRKHPDVMDRVGSMGDGNGDPYPPRIWVWLDYRLNLVLHGLGLQAHAHESVKHLHDYAIVS